MISFEKINEFDSVYHVCNHYLRWSHNKLYYKKIQVIGYENVPPKGYPTFVIGNHTNALMDPLAILYMFRDKRQPVFIARGDIFKKDAVARFLRFLKILPTFRSRDGGRSDVRSNLETFDLSARILNEGSTLCMFPEAGHQPGRFFSTFKKGFPRIAFRAAERSDYQLDFRILPLYIYYTDFFNFRAKQVIVVGKPFEISEFYELYKSEPNKAYLAMNEKARERVRELGLDITDHEHYDQYDMITTVCRAAEIAKQKLPAKEPYSALLADKAVVAKVDALKEQLPERFEQLMTDAAEYRNGLQKLKIRDWLFDRKDSCMSLAMSALLFILLFPLYLFGLVSNFVPFKAPNLITRRLKDKFFTSSINFAIPTMLLFPLWYLILFIVMACCVNWWAALIGVCAAFGTLFAYYAYKKAFVKFIGRCRFYHNKRKNNKLQGRLATLRNNILRMID